MKDGKARSAQQQATATPVTRRNVAIVRQGADNLKINSEEHRRIAAEMAKLRGEAIQARRLAEHIQMLASPAGTGKREQKPMNTSLSNRQQDVQEKRRRTDSRVTGGSQLSFNPLHPSSELPPEQLIRLLGMETRKTRKQPKSAKNTASRQPGTSQGTGQEPAGTFTAEKRHSHRKSARAVTDSQIFGSKRKGLLVSSIVSGALAGVAISAYLFLGETPPSTATARNTSSVSVTPERTPPGARIRPVTGEKPVRQPSPAKTLAAEISKTVATVSPAQIQTEQKRLRAEAEQRLAERLAQWAVTRELAAESSQDPVFTPIKADTPAQRDTSVQSESPDTAVSESSEVPPLTEATANDLPELPAPEPEVVEIEGARLPADTSAKTGVPVTVDKNVGLEPVAPDIEATAAEAATSTDDTDLF